MKDESQHKIDGMVPDDGGFARLEETLRALPPAEVGTSTDTMMYRCGYAAGRAALAAEETGSRPMFGVAGVQRRGLALMCAAVLGACLVGPWAFWWGRRDATGEMLADRMVNAVTPAAASGSAVEDRNPAHGSAPMGTQALDMTSDERPGVGGARERAAWERFLIFEEWFERDLSAPVTAARTRVLTSGDAFALANWRASDAASDLDVLGPRVDPMGRGDAGGRVSGGLGVRDGGERRLTARPDPSQLGDWLP